MSDSLIVAGLLILGSLAAVAWTRLVAALLEHRVVVRLVKLGGHIGLGVVVAVVARELVGWSLTRWETGGAGLLAGLALSVAAPYVLRFGKRWAEVRAERRSGGHRRSWDPHDEEGPQP